MKITREQLRVIRKVYRLTLAEMAALLDVSDSLLCRIERGDRVLTDGLARRVVDEFELTPEKLVRIYEVYYEFGGQAPRRVRRPVIAAV